MFRRAVGSLLAPRFSPRATPSTAPARSLHSLKDLPIGEGLINASLIAAGLLAGYGGGAFAFRHSKKGTGAESAAGKVTHNKKLDMEARFERWIAEFNKTYRDEEEKAMRFQLFKSMVETTEALRPPVQESLLPEVSDLADLTDEEYRQMLCHPDGNDGTNCSEMESEPLIMKPEVKQADTQATQIRATQD